MSGFLVVVDERDQRGDKSASVMGWKMQLTKATSKYTRSCDDATVRAQSNRDSVSACEIAATNAMRRANGRKEKKSAWDGDVVF